MPNEINMFFFFGATLLPFKQHVFRENLVYFRKAISKQNWEGVDQICHFYTVQLTLTLYKGKHCGKQEDLFKKLKN